jgi:hypothetical protein
MSEEFIDGVYNYCDRWCERCPLTARCRVYVFEETFRRTDDENAAFWEAFGDLAQREPPPWIEEILAAAGESDEERWLPEESEESPNLPELNAWNRSEESHEQDGDGDPFVRLARDYGMAVHRWLEQHTDLGEIQSDASQPQAAAPEEVRREDALEIVAWYALQISVKLSRALWSEHELDEEIGDSEFDGADDDAYDDDAVDDDPAFGDVADEHDADDDEADEIRAAIIESSIMDRDGSAKVSLIGIERSLGAWTMLRDHYPQHQATIRGFQQTLARLRRHIDDRLPAARTLQRPGFEYDV